MSAQPVKLAVLLSGSGRTLENFLEKIQAGQLDVEICAVASSRPKVRGVKVARAAGLPCGIFARKDYPDPATHNAAINEWLTPFGPQIIALAGYLCFYMPPEGFQGPVVNIHPALLPRHGGQGFYGDKVHQAVLAAGDQQSGCTVHLVSDRYDEGRILDQAVVPVWPQDDVHVLAQRVFAAECELYPRVLNRLAGEIQGAGE